MLDEEEFSEIAALHLELTKSLKAYRAETGVALKHLSLKDHFQPVLAKYEALTGFKESNVNAIMHHRLSLYGPACHVCGKPLRTPQAKVCGNCMAPRV
jgi:hypothetical protein